ncbi:MAG: FG-GAP-like repeat-containing protein [Terriglobales bacterium]
MSRVLSRRLIRVFAVLVSGLVMAQSKGAPLVSQRNGLSLVQASHLEVSTNISQTAQAAPFALRGARVFKGVGTRLAPGLDFAPAVFYGTDGFSDSEILPTALVSVTDVNRDGKVDLVVANTDSNTVGILLGNGDGTFQAAVTYGSGAYYASSVAVGDVNGDGKPDIVVTNELNSKYQGVVSVLLGNGDGTFQAAVPYYSGGYCADSVAIADVNGDGKPDLVVANSSENGNQGCTSGIAVGAVGVLLGNGDGTFQEAVTYSAVLQGSNSVAVVDVNGDGKPDVVVADLCGGGCGAVSVLLGNGDGTFQAAVSYNSGGYEAYSMAVDDVNGDGKPDLLVANLCGSDGCGSSNGGNVGVLLGKGDGTFQKVVTYGSGGFFATSVAAVDVNDDGKPDIVVANSCDQVYPNCSNGLVGVLLGNGDGTFQTAAIYDSGYYALSVAVRDVNGDDKPDLVVVDQCASQITCSNGQAAGVLINTSIKPTATVVTSSLNPSNFGQAVTFTAKVTSKGYKGTPTGTVTFYDGTTNLGTANLNGKAKGTLTTSALAVGTHSITATYNGDSISLLALRPCCTKSSRELSSRFLRPA